MVYHMSTLLAVSGQLLYFEIRTKQAIIEIAGYDYWIQTINTVGKELSKQ